jgi:hypothetical protein
VQLGLNQLQVGDTALIDRVLSKKSNLLQVALVVEITDLDGRLDRNEPMNVNYPGLDIEVDVLLSVVEDQRFFAGPLDADADLVVDCPYRIGSSPASSARVSAIAGGGALRWRLITTAGLE